MFYILVHLFNRRLLKFAEFNLLQFICNAASGKPHCTLVRKTTVKTNKVLLL